MYLFFLCPPTLWSQCGYQPSHCGSRWRWAGWRHSRFSGLPERCVEPFPRPSARETAQSCGRPTQVSDTLACRIHSREGPPALRASFSSDICGCLISEEVCCPWRPQALNVPLHHGLFTFPLWFNHPVWGVENKKRNFLTLPTGHTAFDKWSRAR